MRMQYLFSSLLERMMEAPVFRVKDYTYCYTHPPLDKKPRDCVRCRLDIELKWFVEALGDNYVLLQ